RNRDPGVMRLLDHRDVSRIEQDARGEIEALLRAVGDHDLVRLADDTQRPLQICGEGIAQRRVPGRVRIPERVAGGAPRPRGQPPPPDFPRKLVDGWLAVAKIVAETGR